MRAVVKQVEGLTMVGKADSNHWAVMDMKKEYRGAEGGSTPMELVLIALGGCFGMNLVSLVSKRGGSLTGAWVELDADQATEHPHVFTRISVKCVLRGEGLKDEDVEWAVKRTREKYCPVGAMLGRVTDVTYSWEIAGA